MCTLHGRCTSRCSHLPQQQQGLARALTKSLTLPLALATTPFSATPSHIATLTPVVSICLSARCQLFGFRICNELVGVDVVALHTQHGVHVHSVRQAHLETFPVLLLLLLLLLTPRFHKVIIVTTQIIKDVQP